MVDWVAFLGVVIVALVANIGGFLLLRKQGRKLDTDSDATIADKAMDMLDKWEERATKLEETNELHETRIEELEQQNGMMAQAIKLLARGVFALTEQLETMEEVPDWVPPDALRSVLEHKSLFNLQF